MAYPQALAEACQLDQAVAHPLARAADFPPVPVAGYRLDQAVAYQRALMEDCLLDPAAVSPLGPVAVFRRGLVADSRRVREVGCRPVRRRT